MSSSRIVLLAACFALSGCLDPLVDDDVPPQGLVLPAGTAVPNAHDDPEIDNQIAANDGVDGEVKLLSGFAHGQTVRYWNFGPTPSIAAPIFVLIDGDGNFVDHNTVVETIPGDQGYSPYWAVFTVQVTDQYNGELLTSIAAIREAEELGLVHPPVRQDFAVNCPAVANGVTLDIGTGTPKEPDKWFYWQGQRIKYYDLGLMPLDQGVIVPDVPVYVLRREGGEPLSEPRRGIDITGDGDTVDTNDLFTNEPFEINPTTNALSPLCRTVYVAVPSTYGSIDTSGDESVADFRTATDVFNPDPVPGNVIAFEETNELWNCAQQPTP